MKHAMVTLRTVVYASVALLVTANISLAQATTDAVRIYVAPVPSTAEGGFVDAQTQRLNDSHADLLKAIQWKVRKFTFVQSPDDADITLALLSAAHEPSGIVRGETGPSLYGRRTTREEADTYPVLRVELTAGPYKTELKTKRTNIVFWKQASDDVASQIGDWVKKNHAQILARRAQ